MVEAVGYQALREGYGNAQMVGDFTQLAAAQSMHLKRHL